MGEWQNNSVDAATSDGFEQVYLESRATARELRCLLRVHECGPRAEQLLQRMETITDRLAQVRGPGITDSCSHQPVRGKDRWLGINC